MSSFLIAHAALTKRPLVKGNEDTGYEGVSVGTRSALSVDTRSIGRPSSGRHSVDLSAECRMTQKFNKRVFVGLTKQEMV